MRLRAFLVLLGLFYFAPSAFPCTTFSFTANEPIVAKNLDWFSGQGLLYVNKRNTQKVGIFVTGHPLVWTSRYMSLTVSQTGREFPWEGMNEAGLTVNTLQLVPSEPPPGTDPRTPIDYVQWVQYILDTSANVREAIANANRVRVVAPMNIHYFVCDASSACATFEYVKGELVIHTQQNLPVKALANHTYSDSVSYLGNLLKTSDPDSILGYLSNDSRDRFSRAALWSTRYSNDQNPIRYGFRALDNLSEVFPTLRTYWSMVFALRSRVMNIMTLAAQKPKWVFLSKFNPSCKSGVQILDMNDPNPGDASPRFRAYTDAANSKLVQMNDRLTPEVKASVKAYPGRWTRCLDK